MAYVDGFLIPVPTKNLTAYRKMSEKAGKVWMEHGALDYKECVGDDLVIKDMKRHVPQDCAQRTAAISVVFSWIIYKDKAHRAAVLKNVMADAAPERHGERQGFAIRPQAHALWRLQRDRRHARAVKAAPRARQPSDLHARQRRKPPPRKKRGERTCRNHAPRRARAGGRSAGRACSMRAASRRARRAFTDGGARGKAKRSGNIATTAPKMARVWSTGAARRAATAIMCASASEKRRRRHGSGSILNLASTGAPIRCASRSSAARARLRWRSPSC